MKRKIISILFLFSLFLFPVWGKDSFPLENAIINVAKDTGPAVVSISTVVKEKVGGFYYGSPFNDFGDEFFRRFFEEFFGPSPYREYKRMGLGSGVIIDKEGYILTNEHVIRGASKIKVKLSDGREFDAEIKGKDVRSDLAIIKIKAKNLPVAKLGDSDRLKIGQWVVAIGNPFGFAIENPEPTVTVGVISALHRFLPALGKRERQYDDLIQTDAAINPGNSGGPLVNLYGEVVGINTAIITMSGGYEGIGFAIPINKAKRIINKLIKGEKVLYGWLGITIQDLNDDLRSYFGIKEREGVIVVKVFNSSPADKAGIKEGDLILSFDGKKVKTSRDLVRMVSATEVGKRVEIKVLRDGREHILEVKVGRRPEDTSRIFDLTEEGEVRFRGMTVEDVTSSSLPYPYRRRGYRKGVVIVDIEEGSPAEKSGLEVGDVIIKIEEEPISNIEDFKRVVSKVKGDCLVKTQRGYFVIKK